MKTANIGCHRDSSNSDPVVVVHAGILDSRVLEPVTGTVEHVCGHRNLNNFPSPGAQLGLSMERGDELKGLPVGTASRSASLFLAKSALMIQPSTVVLPVTECFGEPSISKFQPGPVGLSFCSSGSPSGLGIRHGALEIVDGPQAPIPGSIEHAGPPAVHPHIFGVNVSTNADAFCPTDALGSCSPGVSWTSVVEKRAIGDENT